MSNHVQKELLKLHGIEFHGNIMIIEEEALPGKTEHGAITK